MIYILIIQLVCISVAFILMKGMRMLELDHIRKSFGDKTVLKDITLTVETGEIISILGSSGSGKTTLLNIILGILNSDSGKLMFNGEDITDAPLEDRNFNIVFQDYALFPHLNAYDNIVYGLKNQEGATDEAELKEIIDLFDLSDHLNKRISELSGGQKQRVALARTIVMKPKVLLLDEPLSALDSVIKESIKELIKEISNRYNLTTIMVTHDPEEALTLSDRILLLNQGEVAQYDTPTQIINNPANDFVMDFIIKQLNVKRTNINELFSEATEMSSNEINSDELVRVNE